MKRRMILLLIAVAIVAIALIARGITGAPPKLSKAETEKEDLDNLSEYVAYIEKRKVNENGYAPDLETVHELVEEFYETASVACDNGVYKAIYKTEEGVFLLLDSGLTYLYAPYREGFLSGGGDNTEIPLLIYNVVDEEFKIANKKNAQNYYNEYSAAEKAAKESDLNISFKQYKNFENDISAYKRILEPGRKIISLVGHGLFYKNPDDSSEFGTFILSGIRYDESNAEEYAKYGINRMLPVYQTSFLELFEYWVACLLYDADFELLVVNQRKEILFSPAFFLHISEEKYLKDSMVIIEACLSAKGGENNKLISAMLEKGADVIVGYSESVNIPYDAVLCESFLKQVVDPMHRKNTFSTILRSAQNEAEKADIIINQDDASKIKNGTDYTNDYIDDNGDEVNCEALIFGKYKDKTVEEWLSKDESISLTKENALAYKQILEDNKDAIDRYDYRPDMNNRKIAFCDINNDNIPEL